MSPKISARIKIAVMAAGVGAVCWVAGCAKKSAREAVPETHDTLTVTRDTFTDKRDVKTYRTVRLPDGKIWMAENLNYQMDSSWCYKNSADSCNKYGRLYNWNAAVQACPTGYHLPTNEEWETLANYAGGDRAAGKKLKARHGWNDFCGHNDDEPCESGNGVDEYGFLALPGGGRRSDGSFNSAGFNGIWWTATTFDASRAYYRNTYTYNEHADFYYDVKGHAFSVRCVGNKNAVDASSQKSADDDRAKIEMVFVKGGTFRMGCTSEQGNGCFDDEKPTHSVTVSDFYIGKYEVTQSQWVQVMGSSNHLSYFEGDSLPVEMVSWNDVQKFILRLNAMTGKKYRLPTEAEWEYAARGGANSKGYKYSGNNNCSDVAWYYVNSGDKVLRDGLFEEYSEKNVFDGYDEDLSSNKNKTWAVGTKAPNELGIYDMSGNVWEWVSDWYGEYGSAAQTNPKGPSSGSNRVLRGGGWYNGARFCRVSYRYSDIPDYGYSSIGFRLALSP